MQSIVTRKDFIRLTIAFIGTSAATSACSDETESSSSSGAASGSSGTASSSSGSTTSSSSSSSSSGGSSSGSPVVDAGSDASDAGPMTDAGDSGGSACGAAKTYKEGQGITSNHAHAFMIPVADFAGNANKTYTMSGGHAHDVTITAAQFAMLRAGQTINVTSTGGGGGNHTHACTISC